MSDKFSSSTIATGLLKFFALVAFLPWSAFAVYMKGDWAIATDWDGASYPQAWEISEQASPDGSFIGLSTYSVGGSPFGTLSGTISGNSFTITNPYFGDYTAVFVGTVSEDGNTVTGTWSSTYGQSGSFSGTRVSQPFTVEGNVKNREGDGVAGITINLTGETANGDPVSKTTTTGDDGAYSFEVEKGTYNVEATGEGDFDDNGEIKKENGGKLSAETDVGGNCGGTAEDNICRLTPIENENGVADFIYTLCAADERMPNGKPQTHCPIILVPGFLGSRVVCEGGTELWPGLPFIGWAQMYLQSDGETNNTNNGSCNLTANAVPGNDGLLTTVAGTDIYQNAIDFLNREASGRWWGAAYDWRKSAEKGTVRLDLVVDDALETTGAKYVTLYGHSMGGLVIRDYVNDSTRANKVARIMTAGTPYWGAPKSHFALLGGYVDTPAGTALDHVTWAEELQRLARNLQGLFFLYPSRQFGSWLHVARSALGLHEVQYEADEDFWVESLGANPALLQNARNWHTANDGFPQTDIDYRAVVGSGTGTVAESRIRAPFLQKAVGNIIFGNGDGTVPLRSATQGASETGSPLGKAVPIYYACGVGHLALPGHAAVLPNIRGFLLNGENVSGLTDQCPYTGAVLYVFELNLGGGNTDISVSTSGSLPAGPTTMTLDEAADSGLVQFFSVGKTSVIVTDDARPVTIAFTGKRIAVQMQRIGSAGNGPLENYKSTSGSLVINPSDQSVTINGVSTPKFTLSSKTPKTTLTLSKKGGKWVVKFKAKSPNGIAATYYRVSKKGEVKQYSRAIKLNDKALKGLKFYSVDSFGQAEKLRAAVKSK